MESNKDSEVQEIRALTARQFASLSWKKAAHPLASVQECLHAVSPRFGVCGGTTSVEGVGTLVLATVYLWRSEPRPEVERGPP